MSKSIKIILGSLITLLIIISGYFITDYLLFDGVKSKPISESGFKGHYFSKKNLSNQTTILIIGGGIWGEFWGQEFAKRNYVALSIPYYGLEGLPDLMEEIPLEYFKNAIEWVKRQSEVDDKKIIVMGASRNAELALVIASHFPNDISGVIAYSPSSVSWSNTVMPFNSENIKPSWTYNNKPVPYISMPKLIGKQASVLETLTYWNKGLDLDKNLNKASIQVEKINGPILLFSGLSDEVWPAAQMSNFIEKRARNNSFKFKVDNIKYENAGHLISGNPNYPPKIRQGNMIIDGKQYQFNFGGTEEGDVKAQKDAFKRVFKYLNQFNDD